MIIDCETWKRRWEEKHRSPKLEGLPVFVSWKKLKEMMVGDQQAYSIEVSELGLMLRVNMYSYDERGKHPLLDKQV